MQAVLKWGVGIFALLVLLASASFAQTPTPGKTPAAKETSKTSSPQQPEWKKMLMQANEAERKGSVQKAQELLEEAYRAAPAGEDKAQVAFQIGAICEKQKRYDDARRWYLQAIYDAPKGPLAAKARDRMRALPDSRRPAAAGATPAGGSPNPVKPK
jgi:tetratricopeptide (TPR) repeat protein